MGNVIIKEYAGLIRNYRQLAKELSVDINDLSRKDREEKLLLSAYEKWGYDIGNHINGQFALVLFDESKNETFAVRDQFGLQQLFYYLTDDGILCTLSIKDMLKKDGFKKEFNEKVLQLYLGFTYIAGEETFFKGLYKLMPCKYLVFNENGLKIERYFEAIFTVDESKSEDDFASEIESGLISALKEVKDESEVADSFLSGGVDSSYLLAMSDAKIAYSASYEHKGADESELAKQTAEKLNRNFVKYTVTPEEYFASVKQFMYDMESPTGDASSLVFAICCKEVVKHSKICYSGEGSDEWFGGYNIYRKAEEYMNVPSPLFCGNTYIMHTPEQKRLLKRYHEEYSMANFRKNLYADLKMYEPLTRMLDIDQRIFLEGSIFHNVRRISDSSGLDIRTPYVDMRIYDVALHAPAKFKINGENNKIVLRKAAERVLPKEVAWRTKKGFPVPIRDWLLDKKYNEGIFAKLHGEVAEKFFNIDELDNLILQFTTDHPEFWRKIWTIYTFILWYEVFFINKD